MYNSVANMLYLSKVVMSDLNGVKYPKTFSVKIVTKASDAKKISRLSLLLISRGDLSNALNWKRHWNVTRCWRKFVVNSCLYHFFAITLIQFAYHCGGVSLETRSRKRNPDTTRIVRNVLNFCFAQVFVSINKM